MRQWLDKWGWAPYMVWFTAVLVSGLSLPLTGGQLAAWFAGLWIPPFIAWVWFARPRPVVRPEGEPPSFDDLGTADLRRAADETATLFDRRITKLHFFDAVCEAALDIPEIRDHPAVRAFAARCAQYEDDEKWERFSKGLWGEESQ